MISSELQHGTAALPRWRHTAAKAIFRLLGWKVEMSVPQDPKFVVIAAPHTSNWDGFYMLVALSVCRMQVRFLYKDTMPFPLGPILKAFGGIPISRKGGTGLVEQAADRLEQAEKMVLIVAPAGTRSRTEHWKSGFYRIAERAGVPVVCGSLDYGAKVASIGPRIDISGDIVADMGLIRAAYAGKQGRDPASQTPIRLREELPDTSPAD